MASLLVFVEQHLGSILLTGWVVGVSVAFFLARGLWRRFRMSPDERPAAWRAIALGIGTLAATGCAGFAAYALVEVGPAIWAQSRMVDQPAPSLAYRRVADDTAGSLSDHRGKVVLVNVWATWCPPCREEMPDLDRLQRTYRDRGLVVLNVSDEARSTLLSYLEAEPMTTEHGYVSEVRWHAYGRPTSYLVDRQGVLRRVAAGGRDYERFERMVEPFL